MGMCSVAELSQQYVGQQFYCEQSECKGDSEAAGAAATAAQGVAVETLKPSSKLSFPWLTVLQQIACSPLQPKGYQQHTLLLPHREVCRPFSSQSKWLAACLPLVVLGRNTLGSFKEDRVIDCYLEQISLKLLLD